MDMREAALVVCLCFIHQFPIGLVAKEANKEAVSHRSRLDFRAQHLDPGQGTGNLISAKYYSVNFDELHHQKQHWVSTMILPSLSVHPLFRNLNLVSGG